LSPFILYMFGLSTGLKGPSIYLVQWCSHTSVFILSWFRCWFHCIMEVVYSLKRLEHSKIFKLLPKMSQSTARHTNTWPLNCLAWYMHLIKSGGVKISLMGPSIYLVQWCSHTSVLIWCFKLLPKMSQSTARHSWSYYTQGR
jgi:hypothetical protein